MATVKILRRIEKINKEGKAPLYLRLIKDRRPKYISLGILLTEDEWDEEKFCVTKKHRNSAHLNAYISQKVAEAEAVALDMETKSKSMTSRKIKEQIMGKAPTDFFVFAQKRIDALETSDQVAMYKRTKTAVQKLKDYLKGSPLIFTDITYSFLKKYEDYLRAEFKNSTNTISSNFKIIRKLINDAVKEDIITHNDNPFLRMKLKSEPSQREFLTEEELQKIEDLKIPEDQKLNDHRKAYIFAAYAGGLRISDVLQLKWNNFDGERINLVMHKTGRQLNIKLPLKALEIINSYRQEDCKSDDFIFPFLRNDKDYSSPLVLHNSLSSATTLANHALITIAERAKIDKHISFHTSRHTFATRALRKGIRIEYVSKLLGHASISETQVYAKIVNEELDKAMSVFDE